ncbi:glycosyltransferase family 2 protein [Shewanella phaeophyticola]|uniref:Glycosyltransferase family 2 protein n=1 Tax=Shewanella phaeophyticola TaxID=2978345 RepID=A0ABT2NZC3_9GAMM|nr:glycosyltransferase family 2 protein [Shewanella sp. KJ10-1]MCT8985753.1 glycosyltransferase family 2 protein [Shewanella sp. KJ10-1]
MSNSIVKSKVKLVAIAKDEAAYIPEWVHHHLFLGFDDIEIFINRTTDNSEAVLNSISQHYPNVSWQYADWIDWCPSGASKHIQFITYAKAMYDCQQAAGFTHIFFLDIDEFLILDGLTSSIHEVIGRYPQATPVAFEWINDCTPAAAPFSRLPLTLTGNLSPLVKTLLPVNIGIKEFRHHLPLFTQPIDTLLVDESVFKGQDKIEQALDKSVNSLKSSFIYHRAHRSQYEYVSLLYRGRPGDNFAYKSNRRGYPKLTAKSCRVVLDEPTFAEYQSSYANFIDSIDSASFVVEAEKFVCDRYQHSIDNIDNHLSQDYPLMMRLFSGVTDEHVLTAFKQYRSKLIALEPNNVDLLIRLSSDAQQQDINEAINIISLAKKIRPNGPLINKRLDQLVQLKSSLSATKER